MKPFLRQQLDRYAFRLEELNFLLSRDDIMGDMAQYRLISKEQPSQMMAISRVLASSW